jgi:hypothetical protein
MIKKLLFLLSVLFGLALLAVCNSGVRPVATPPRSPQTGAENKVLPTPVAPGQGIFYNDLQLEMVQAEITTSYITEYGSRRDPTLGGKFLWVHLQLKNNAPNEYRLPTPEHFSVLYGTTEFKSSYGHRQGYTDYTALGTGMFPGQIVDAWLRFDIPAVAELGDLQFVFIPEGLQVSTSFSPTEYPWADHPIYLWGCAP